MTVFGSAFPESDFEKSAFGGRSDLQMIKTTYHHRFLESRISNAFLTEKCFSLVEISSEFQSDFAVSRHYQRENCLDKGALSALIDDL